MYPVFRGVNDAFRGLVKVFAGSAEDVAGTYGVPVVRRPSRNGGVLVIAVFTAAPPRRLY